MTRYLIGPCPACSSSAHTLIADADAIRDELELLWAFHTQRLRGSTPPDRLHDRVAFSQEPALRIVRCDTCGLLFRNPREKTDELLELYRDEQPDPASLLSLFHNQAASYRAQVHRLTRIAGRAGTGIEVGSYVGAFLAAARGAGWTFIGLDVNPAVNDFARARGFHIREATLDDIDPRERCDVIAFWNCFDQLPDPVAAATAARIHLDPRGWIAVRVPNGAFYAHWRARLHSPLRPLARTLLAHNNLLAFPYRHGFSLPSLRSLLENARFRVRHVFGDSLVPIADHWTRPWARLEERAVKAALRPLPAARSPWIEVYAQAI